MERRVPGYVAQQRSAIRRRQLELAVSENVAAPKLLVAALADVERETRAIDYFVLPKDAGPEPAAPSPEMLKAYFEDRKSAFAAPEIRSFRYVLATPASLAKPDEVSDEDARPVYDQQKEKRFFQPERRKLQQMVFDKEADAADALAKLKAGASFEDVAKEKGKTDIDLGEQTQAEIFDKDLAVAAFALAQGAYGDVVKGQFGYVIPRVLAITPAQTIPFEEIGVIIKSEIARDRAAKQIQGLHDKFEDAKTNGKTLEEAAKSLGLEVRLVAGVDHGGLDAAGAKVELPDAATLLSAVFGSDIGVDNDSLRTKDRGYIWFDVTKVDAAHERGFDEVQELVEKRRRTDEADKALVEKASDLVKRLREGATVAALAEELKLAVKQAKDLRRDTRGDLGEAAVVAVFAGPANDSGSAATPEGRLIFKVTADVTPPVDPADEAIKTLVEKTGNMLAADLVQQYIAGIKRELGVKIDAAAVKAAQGG